MIMKMSLGSFSLHFTKKSFTLLLTNKNISQKRLYMTRTNFPMIPKKAVLNEYNQPCFFHFTNASIQALRLFR